MEYALSLFIGIFSSLLATALFIGISELFRKVILPWYADKIYRGTRVDGTWESESVGELKETIVITQKGDVISGIYSHRVKDETTDSITRYILNGILKDTYITATALPESRYMLDSLSFILRIYHDPHGSGLILGGKSLFVATSTGEIKVAEEKFKKNEDA